MAFFADVLPVPPLVITSRRSLLALAAALLLGSACAMSAPLRFVAGLPLVCGALAHACRALLAQDSLAAFSKAWIWIGLSMMSALGLVTTGTRGPFLFELARRAYCLEGLIVIGIVASADDRARSTAMHCLLLSLTILLAVTPIAIPHPPIDVFQWTMAASKALLDGVHPYTVKAVDVYAGQQDFGFAVDVYPYMPATLMAFVPAVGLFGDFRFVLAASLTLTLYLIRRIGRVAIADARFVDAAVLALALHPDIVLVVRSGWTEPLLVLAMTLFAYGSVVHPQRKWSTVVLCLVPALKQYALAPLILAFWWGARRRWTVWLTGVAVAAMTVLPFLLWNFSATLHGALFQMRAPMRPRFTGISIPAMLVSNGHSFPPIWLSVAVELTLSGVAAIVARKRDLPDLLIGSAVALIATFLMGWQAFVNYYFFVGALLVLAAVTAAAPCRARI